MRALARPPAHHVRASMASKIAVAVAAASGMVLTTVPGEATTGCPPNSGNARSALRVAGLLEQAPGSWGARLSADGRYVAFVSYDDDLVVRGRQRPRRCLPRRSGHGRDPAGERRHQRFGVRKDTRPRRRSAQTAPRVAFSSPYQVHVRDIGAARTIHVSVNDAGAAADDWSGAPVLSPGGALRRLHLPGHEPRDAGPRPGASRPTCGTSRREPPSGSASARAASAAPTWSWAEAVSEEGRYVAFTAGGRRRVPHPRGHYPGCRRVRPRPPRPDDRGDQRRTRRPVHGGLVPGHERRRDEDPLRLGPAAGRQTGGLPAGPGGRAPPASSRPSSPPGGAAPGRARRRWPSSDSARDRPPRCPPTGGSPPSRPRCRPGRTTPTPPTTSWSSTSPPAAGSRPRARRPDAPETAPPVNRPSPATGRSSAFTSEADDLAGSDNQWRHQRLRPRHGHPANRTGEHRFLHCRPCLLRLAQAAIELQHIGDVLGNLVAGAVAADDDVAHGDSPKMMLPWRV